MACAHSANQERASNVHAALVAAAVAGAHLRVEKDAEEWFTILGGEEVGGQSC